MASNPQFLDYAGIVPRPWKNGRGVTRNLFDDGHGGDGWTWRVSIAEISGAQPYSSYPGVRRILMALGPGNVEMTVDGRGITLAPEDHAAFDGEAPAAAVPSAEGFLDFNVMARRDAWTSDLTLVAGTGSADADSGEVVVLVSLRTGSEIDGRRLERLDAAMVPSRAAVALEGRFALARLRAVGTA